MRWRHCSLSATTSLILAYVLLCEDSEVSSTFSHPHPPIANSAPPPPPPRPLTVVHVRVLTCTCFLVELLKAEQFTTAHTSPRLLYLSGRNFYPGLDFTLFPLLFVSCSVYSVCQVNFVEWICARARDMSRAGTYCIRKTSKT